SRPSDLQDWTRRRSSSTTCCWKSRRSRSRRRRSSCTKRTHGVRVKASTTNGFNAVSMCSQSWCPRVMHEARSVRTMSRRFSRVGSTDRSWSLRTRSRFRVCAACLWGVSLAVLVAACGSTPSEGQGKRGSRDAREASRVAGESLQEALPPEAVQRFDAAVVHMNAGDLAAAEQGFRALASEFPSYSGPLVNLGIIAAKAGKLDEAEKTLKQATERNPQNAAAFNQLGIVYRKLGRFQDADQAYQQAVRIDPQYANAYLNLGVLCDLYLQEPERALEAYERYL